MPRFAANLTMLFNEYAFLDRFEAAAKAGFDAVEFLFPYAFEAQEIRKRLDDHGLTLVLHNLPPGDWGAGERGIACHPNRIVEFEAGVAKGIAYAQALGVGQLNCLAGIAPLSIAHAELHQTFVANLIFAAKAFAAAGLKLLIEPINTYDIPSFFLNRTAQAIAILDEVQAKGQVDNVFLQYDIYHAQRMEGELAANMQRYLARIGHIQLADNPGRNEPGSGEINFPYLFAQLDHWQYKGWIGCEYRPATTTKEGLGWMAHTCAVPHPPLAKEPG